MSWVAQSSIQIDTHDQTGSSFLHSVKSCAVVWLMIKSLMTSSAKPQSAFAYFWMQSGKKKPNWAKWYSPHTKSLFEITFVWNTHWESSKNYREGRYTVESIEPSHSLTLLPELILCCENTKKWRIESFIPILRSHNFGSRLSCPRRFVINWSGGKLFHSSNKTKINCAINYGNVTVKTL